MLFGEFKARADLDGVITISDDSKYVMYEAFNTLYNRGVFKEQSDVGAYVNKNKQVLLELALEFEMARNRVSHAWETQMEANEAHHKEELRQKDYTINSWRTDCEHYQKTACKYIDAGKQLKNALETLSGII